MNNDLLLLDKIGWEGIKLIKFLRKDIRRHLRTKGICKIITQAIKHEFGLEAVSGNFRGREHRWNVFPEGEILDASADQFGLRPIRVVLPTDTEYTDYSSPQSKERII